MRAASTRIDLLSLTKTPHRQLIKVKVTTWHSCGDTGYIYSLLEAPPKECKQLHAVQLVKLEVFKSVLDSCVALLSLDSL